MTTPAVTTTAQGEAALSADNAAAGAAPTSFEWDAQRYQQQHSFVYQAGQDLLDWLPPVWPGQRLLDVGCGTGQLTQQLADRHQAATQERPVVMGMDADANMVAAARASFPDVVFFQADVRNFTLPPGPTESTTTGTTDGSEPKVDVIFSNAVLHWVPPHEFDNATASMARVLVPGGYWVVEFGGKGNIAQIQTALERAVAPYRENMTIGAAVTPSPWYYPSIGELGTVLERHGLEVQRAVLFDRPTPLNEHESGLANWIRMFGMRYLAGLSEDQVQAVIMNVENELRPTMYDPTTRTWTADYRRIRVMARKVAS